MQIRPDRLMRATIIERTLAKASRCCAGALLVAIAGCGGADVRDQGSHPEPTSSVSAALDDGCEIDWRCPIELESIGADSAGNQICCPRDPCRTFSHESVGYGQMGTFDGCHFKDHCAPGLVPMNVETYSGQYNKAADGEFSCWGNTPDVLCPNVAPINGYVNVRQCYTRPNGTKTDYGCFDCCPPNVCE